ncbi:hypothetical protein DHEL01_v201151 [Diaporthe helianthi]|uniref:RING-type domain-containing protein n=1 Tax=Diaporthe helianthi TaxID=158607 RepID=A0A2P5ID72_DIAHE|nr:hypothetical protein DHEL01_v201151 [Diaporthe helianthi]
MTNWSPFLSDGMDAWIYGSWPDQQSQANSLQPQPSLQSSHPFLPPLLNSLTSFHSTTTTLASPTHSLGRLANLGRIAPAASPAYGIASGLGPQSSFTAPPVSTSSQLARRRRRDGPSLALSHNPSTDLYRPFRPTDSVPNTTTSTTNSSAATTTANSIQNSSQQHSHLPLLPQPSVHNTASQTLHNLLTSPLDDFLNDNPRQLHLRNPTSDDFLEALATGDFSSPSLAPRSPQSPPHPPSHLQFILDPPPRQQTNFRSFITAAHRLPGPVTGLCKVEDQGDGEDDLENDSALDSPHSEMPATRKRPRAAVAASPNEHEVGPSAPKRARTYVAQRAATPGRSRNTPRAATSRNYTPAPAVAIESDDNDFDSIFGGDNDSVGMEIFDLTKSEEEVPKELFQPVKDSSIKLSAFECVICMDAATNLTVTCCGHMFCAQCLHQAMHTEITKKVCPMCRQRLDKSTPKSKPPAKAFFHLELKLRPSKKMGKQPARR